MNISEFSLILFLLCVQNTCSKYGFYRDMDRDFYLGTRRIFGGDSADINEFPGTCLLTDARLKPKCTGTIIKPHFVVTAAHCITPRLHFVVYNTRNLKSDTANKATVTRVYYHPGFKFEMKDEGRGMDVVKLTHDIGLVETQQAMILNFPARRFTDLTAMRTAPAKLYADVKILGFGRTTDPNAEELLKVKLRIMKCDRETWLYCACGATLPGERARGVCSGDSGGPVVLNDTLVGVTSMGPTECSAAGNDNFASSTSVFTLVSRYVDIIDNTINHKTNSEVMNEMILNPANSGSDQKYSENGHSMTVPKNALKIIWIVNALILQFFLE